MKKKSLSILLAMLVLVAMVVAGCGGSSGTAGTTSGGSSTAVDAGGAIALTGKNINDESVKIAYIPISTAGVTNVLAEQAADVVKASYPNLEINFFDASYNAQTQTQIVNECIAQKYDAIIMEVADSVALAPVIQQAEEAGIVVITSNMGCEQLHTLHIENSSYQSGLVGGEAIVEKLGGEGKVIILDVPAELKAVSLFGTGFEDYVTENSNIEIIDTQNIAGFSQEEANTVMRDLLTKYDDIDAIYCAADDVAIGAIQAIDSAGRSGDGIVLWGSDCLPAGIEAIQNGKLYGTCFGDQYGSVKEALTLALYFVETGINSVSAGYTATPTIVRGFVPVTAENVDTIAAQAHWPDFS